MRKLFVIGIGAGDPEQVTLQAVRAIRQVDVFFMIGKGDTKQELIGVREQILRAHADQPYRVVAIEDPPRDRAIAATGADAAYRDAVEAWHARRAELLADEFGRTDGVGAVLVWGDPSLYDSTLRLIERVPAHFEVEVIPGITSAQALAARHRIVLHEIGEPVHITTGRRLREDGVTQGVSTLVMLDGDCSFTQVPADGLHIWWAAYLGMPDEELIEGPLGEAGPRIVARRQELRAAKGWIMDIYLLRADG
ncbi:precorrin-6A synthase (deacetylating) [Nocardia stercoris]|uniref:Precorrin-6A synthase (Deacetylating) n=1 Tax=Nocardia stercoris TaxID=2483361 RepID=A0A3M2L0V0_9NOCA|nr:precorrin-6A synthase (deacetylating) [Nocardia stercoris]RMI31014.1 precorrin-6A synthase (deacetylating) [Nocardia stercoris]